MGSFVSGALGGFANEYDSPDQKKKRAAKKVDKAKNPGKLPATAKQGYTPNLADMPVPSYKKGGRVKKTGLAKLHKGEVVVPVRHKKRSKKTAKRR